MRARAAIVVPCFALLSACKTVPEAHVTVGGEHGKHHHAHGMRFEKAEEWTKVFDDPERDAWQRPAEVVTHLKIAQGMTVVDLGAGTGYFLPSLSAAVGSSGHVRALDVEPDLVRFMKERAGKAQLANVEAVLVPFDDPQLAPAAVDRVLIVDTWHHIEARPAYVKKLAAALRPSGFVAIVDFTLESSKGPPKDHKIPPEQAVQELAAGGLDASVLEETLPDQYIVVGVKR